jgi:hypothetical protein
MTKKVKTLSKQMTFLCSFLGGTNEVVFWKPGEKCHTLVITIDIHLIVVRSH